MGYRQENNLGMVHAVEVIRQVFHEDEVARQKKYREKEYGDTGDRNADEPLKFSRKMFLGLLMMVLFVVFCAGYEGARRAFLARDLDKVIAVEAEAETAELELDSCAGDRDVELTKWREGAKSGESAPCRNLGLLCLTGRGGVENSRDEPVMLRTWNVFAFAFYFGMVAVVYYILRPLWCVCRKKRGCISNVAFMAACLLSTYIPGMVVFHYARQWYPALSAWMTKMVGALLQ